VWWLVLVLRVGCEDEEEEPKKGWWKGEGMNGSLDEDGAEETAAARVCVLLVCVCVCVVPLAGKTVGSVHRQRHSASNILAGGVAGFVLTASKDEGTGMGTRRRMACRGEGRGEGEKETRWCMVRGAH
jgi:hypothetical protein